MSEFNQKKYINDWKKDNYKIFKAELKKEEVDKYNELLKENDMTKSEFIRLSFKALEKGKIKKEEQDN